MLTKKGEERNVRKEYLEERGQRQKKEEMLLEEEEEEYGVAGKRTGRARRRGNS